MQGPPQRTDFWAKLKYRDDDRTTGEIVAWHPLLAHCADVAAVTEALLTRTILRKRLARLAGWDDLSPTHVARLCVLAALHDAGKVNHGFQDQAFPGAGRSPGHVGPMVDVLRSDTPLRWLEPLGILPMVGWFRSEDNIEAFLLATWGHHGRPVRPERTPFPGLWGKANGRAPLQALTEFEEAARRWFPHAFEQAEPFPSTPAFQHAFNGLLTLADWLGSDTMFFDYTDESGGYLQRARSGARRSVEQLFLDPGKARNGMEPASLGTVLPRGNEPYPIQQACLELELHPEGSLAILESDTGSGKTEAALARFLRLYRAGLVDGLYFAVPTRTAATQLYDRVTQAIGRVLPDEASRPPVVQAVPGYIKADAQEGVPLPGFEVRWPDDERGALRERGWAAEHPKRYLAGAVVVGTVDQVLLSTLRVNHAHMRSSALLRHLLVVDEVHASDVYMTHLLDAVLDHHLAAGGHAFLMFATLGSAARVRLATNGRGKIPQPEEAEQVDYPLLTHVGADRTDPESIHAASSGQQKEVEAVTEPLADDTAEIARRALAAARDGARVLVIRNLVADCVATQRAVEDLAGDDGGLLFRVGAVPAPHHSRFAPDDRKLLDARIEAYFGKQNTGGGVVAVATSTVEISLDIDADLLFTDLCPMDVLLQRIGRLHRHRRERAAGYEQARCVVLTPKGRDLGSVVDGEGRGRGPHGLGTVYHDLRVIEATWRVLEAEAPETWSIPEHNRLLVERATHPHHLYALVEELGGAWPQHDQYVQGGIYADREMGRLVEIDRTQPFGEEGFPEDGEKIKTRLGADDYQVDLPAPVPGPFGRPVSEMKIPGWLIDGAPPEEMTAQNVQPFDDGLSFSFGGKSFRYDRCGLALVS